MNKLPENWNQWLKTGLTLPIAALNGWVVIQLFQYFEPLLTIFILAAVFAFVLNYPVQFLQKRGVRRGYAVLGVILLALIGLVTLAITLVPTLLEQVTGLITTLPDWFTIANERLQTVQRWASSHHLPINLNRVTAQFTERLPGELESLGDQTLTLTLNAVGGLSSLLLTIVLTLYLMLDGKRVWNTLFQLLPLDNRVHIRRSLQEDFQNYFIGQATLGVVMGVVLSIAFLVLAVPYSLLLGITIGVMTLIPFGDVLGYILISLLLTAQDSNLGPARVRDLHDFGSDSRSGDRPSHFGQLHRTQANLGNCCPAIGNQDVWLSRVITSRADRQFHQYDARRLWGSGRRSAGRGSIQRIYARSLVD
ncbi:MAG: AI-2E family transporter [Leptolyngbyaceae cyanobacterium CRU_2_3]|nr:AI-2E family transporter [Leptolyngbyaceae cyanobacterium CRU_2_3]